MVYYTLGKHDAPAVLLLHGFTGSSQSWFVKGSRYRSGLALDLADAGYRVVSLDLRGHGESARPTDPAKYTDEQELYDIVALANRLQLRRFALVGYSHGSIEAAKLTSISAAASARVASEARAENPDESCRPGRVACAVLGGIGHLLSDKEWHTDYGVNTLAVSLEAKATAQVPP